MTDTLKRHHVLQRLKTNTFNNTHVNNTQGTHICMATDRGGYEGLIRVMTLVMTPMWLRLEMAILAWLAHWPKIMLFSSHLSKCQIF